MKVSKARFITNAGIIAALYVILTLLIDAFDLANGVIQVRISEALTILPFFTSAAIPGLFIGCLLSNILTGCAIWDVIFGSLATLAGAIGSYCLRKNQWLVPIPPIISNMIIVPLLLEYVYDCSGSWPFFVVSIGIGEILSCYVLGMLLLFAIKKPMRGLHDSGQI